MTPIQPEDAGVWAQIAGILARMGVSFVLWLEWAMPVLLPAGFAAFLYGRHFGYRGAALRLFVITGMFASTVGTPVTLSVFGLDVNLWQTVVCCTISVFCWEGVRWMKAIIMKRLGIERRREQYDNAHDIQQDAE